jgi:hypothetical protein
MSLIMRKNKKIFRIQHLSPVRVLLAGISIFAFMSGASLFAVSFYQLLPLQSSFQEKITKPQAIRAPEDFFDNAQIKIDAANNTSQLEASMTSLLSDYYGLNERVIRLCASADCFSKYSPEDKSADRISVTASTSLHRQKEVATTIVQVVSSLPQGWSAQMLPETIMISQRITYDDVLRGGLNFGPNDNQVILLVDTNFVNYPNYTEATFQHELFHSYKRRKLWKRDDINITWQDIDPRVYKSLSQNNKAYSGLVIQNGYTSNYASISIEEDQAETYAFYVTKIRSGEVNLNKINDNVAREKLRYMQKVILKDLAE